MLCILMDADHFRLSLTLLVNRLGMEKKTIQNALKKLEECGYLRRKELNRGNYYIISEYGNLTGTDEVTTPTSEAVEVLESSLVEDTPTTFQGRGINEDEALFILKYLAASEHENHFEKVLDALNTDLLSGIITAIDETAILRKLPKQPTTKTKLPINLGQIRQLYKFPRLFDAMLPIVQEKSGGHMISQKSREDIVLRTMRKFADADEELHPNKVTRFMYNIKGEYTNAGSLDQRYQN
ncbi:winged helix-turn-helix transcriptional regulator [Flavobacterium sp. SE-s28]|uniref:Winged helix-turn-helix transcriptional regulator n=2 Tax=Flavobacterium silvaticum TaxID=1852020 RepID=A0A972FR90_9FLAO|nr:winged helix-turn-helix transcriptional regulator [Flavobacterium silvaticum]